MKTALDNRCHALLARVSKDFATTVSSVARKKVGVEALRMAARYVAISVAGLGLAAWLGFQAGEYKVEAGATSFAQTISAAPAGGALMEMVRANPNLATRWATVCLGGIKTRVVDDGVACDLALWVRPPSITDATPDGRMEASWLWLLAVLQGIGQLPTLLLGGVGGGMIALAIRALFRKSY